MREDGKNLVERDYEGEIRVKMMEEINKRLDEMESRMNEKIKKMDAQLESIKTVLRIKHLQNGIIKKGDRLKWIEKKLKDDTIRWDYLTYEYMKSDIPKLEDYIYKANSEIRELQEKLDKEIKKKYLDFE